LIRGRKLLFHKSRNIDKGIFPIPPVKKALSIFIIHLFLASCSGDKKNQSEEMPELFPAPKSVKLNIARGYTINPLSGDSIKPIINSFGDTVITGKPIPARGKIIDPDNLVIPDAIPIALPTGLNFTQDKDTILRELNVFSLNKDSLKTYISGEFNSSFLLVNNSGDTIPTGIPIPTRGIKVPCILSQPVSALPTGINENSNWDLRHLDQAHGLNSSDVRCMLEDGHGNLWIGTDGGGVSRYNGSSFTHFTVDEGLCNNSVLSILKDSKGNLWFGTNGGVSRYDGSTFLNFTEQEGLANNVVWSILEDKNEIMWFGTWGGGVSRYDGQALPDGQEEATFTHFTRKEGLCNNRVISMLEDKKGNIYFGTWGGGVSRLNGSSRRNGNPSFTHFTQEDGLSNNIVRSMLEDRNGIIWFGTGKGVSRFDGESFTNYGKNEGLESSSIWSILEDSRGNLWFGTSSGVSHFMGSALSDGESHPKESHELEGGVSFSHFNDMNDLNSNIVMSMLEDRQGNLWFGTGEAGVSRFDGSSFRSFSIKQGFKSNDIQDILEDKEGNLWFGTWGGGVSRFDGISFTHFTEEDGLCYNYITSVLEDRKGNLWFGTDGEGVSRYDRQGTLPTGAKSIPKGQAGFSHFTKKEGLSGNSVLSMLEDSKGDIWFGTNNGLTQFNGKYFTHFTEIEGLSNNVIGSIIEDHKGILWFGSWGGGVTRYDGEFFVHFTEKEGLGKNMITSMLEDGNGDLWFGTFGSGTAGGLSRFDGETFTHFTEAIDFNFDVVGSMINDKKGNIWIATEKGLKLIIPVLQKTINSEEDSSGSGLTPYQERKIYTVLGQKDVKGVDFLSNSLFLDNKNRMWWGSGKSLLMQDMNDFNFPIEPPLLHLNYLEINRQFVDFHNIKVTNTSGFTYKKAEPFFNFPRDLELNFNKNHLTFHFSAIDWRAPEKINYSYKIEGLQKNWSKPSPVAMADYLYIQYGTYTFKVRAIGESQVWSEVVNYTFTIQPPWWHTWLARTGYGIIGIWLIFGFVRWRTSRLKARQKELEADVKIATKEIRGQRDEIELQKEKIEEQHKKMKDSISYAKRIQNAILPPSGMVRDCLKESFILYKPKDVVAGDFYWMHSLPASQKDENEKVFFAAADCTGHGVPGAIVSVVCNNALDRSVREYGLSDSGKILDKTRDIVVEEFEKSDEEVKDGMDIALCILEGRRLQFSGANNPLWIVSNGELLVTKGSRQPIGIFDKPVPFSTHTFDLQKDDSIYVFSDGFADQFGGEKNKKFMSSNFKKLILSVQGESMEMQGKLLDEAFEKWRGDFEQIDDVCVIGVKI
jgi:ligand-binding sensor domain-containing protein/serine phosphatase RsbU (regulator of sigma subunit)